MGYAAPRRGKDGPMVRILGMVLGGLLVVGCGGGGGGDNNNQNNSNESACGDSIVTGSEQCDEGAANSDTEADACRTTCVDAACGDGVADTGEACDGDDLNGVICRDHPPYTHGSLSCNLDCTVDTSDCYICGDGVRDPGESCDGSDFGSDDCATAGSNHQHGELQCNADCTADFTLCHTCGDDFIEPGVEDCDGDDLEGLDCTDLGYAWGTLRCNMADTSCAFDVSSCFSFCGNGQMDPGEDCDGDDLPATTCADLDANLTGGQPSCSPSCLLTAATCNKCGNFALDAGEECDGAQLGGASCGSLGGQSGALGCTSSCHYDTSGCTAPATCGNGVVDSGEVCDGTNLGGQTCQGLGSGLYGGGHLACSTTCLLDTSGCTPEKRCGNGVLEPSFGEVCDGSDLGPGADCVSLGYAGGTLACNAQCGYDITGCGVQPPCGNGVVDPGERCDGTPPAGVSCTDLGYLGGSIGCLAQCELDTSGCVSCGDGIMDADRGELCDGADLGGLTCTDTGAFGGVLACDQATCALDTSGCNDCGNGSLETAAGELCDGTEFGGATCASESSYADGELSCSVGCTIDNTACHTCGNMALEGPEQCDYHLVGPGTCATQFPSTYDGGSLDCTADCGDFDVSGCFATGDGVCNSPQETIANSPADCGWVQIAAGEAHTCALRGDDTAWCWGSTADGALGMGSTSGFFATPQAVVGLPLPVLQISVGEHHSCALLDDHSVWCWGYNHLGELGNGGTVTQWSPVQVTGLSAVSKIRAGANFSCALRISGTVHCWGVNAIEGNLGNGTYTNSDIPVQVSTLSAATDLAVTRWAQYVDGRNLHACAVQTGSAYCWGNNDSGQIGTIGQPSYPTPQPISGLGGSAGQVAVGSFSSYALVNGTIRSWGSDGDGQLGDGAGNSSGHTPRAVVAITGVQAVESGSEFACAVLDDNTAWCWGANHYGQMGNGTTSVQDVPGQVLETAGGSPFAGVSSLSVGRFHACVVRTDGTAWCWGYNSSGQLGNSSIVESYVPVPVTEPL